MLTVVFFNSPVFAAEEYDDNTNSCKIIKEENGCYLIEDAEGTQEWFCQEDNISTFDIKCTVDCWDFD